MRAEYLTRMANQIAAFFAPYPEQEAVAGVQDHLLKFWDPAMRRELLALPASETALVHPLVQQAIAGLRASEAP